jgi:hypothetical protein
MVNSGDNELLYYTYSKQVLLLQMLRKLYVLGMGQMEPQGLLATDKRKMLCNHF